MWRHNLRAHHRRRGIALLEVIVALAILSIAALSAVMLVRQSSQTVRRARDADIRMRSASAFMGVVSLWPREDLDRHIGDRRQGSWILHIDHPAAVLYRVTLSDSLGGPLLLETALFRPAPSTTLP